MAKKKRRKYHLEIDKKKRAKWVLKMSCSMPRGEPQSLTHRNQLLYFAIVAKMVTCLVC